MMRDEKDQLVRTVLDNQQYIQRVHPAITGVWERLKSQEEQALEEQNRKID